MFDIIRIPINFSSNFLFMTNLFAKWARRKFIAGGWESKSSRVMRSFLFYVQCLFSNDANVEWKILLCLTCAMLKWISFFTGGGKHENFYKMWKTVKFSWHTLSKTLSCIQNFPYAFYDGWASTCIVSFSFSINGCIIMHPEWDRHSTKGWSEQIKLQTVEYESN